LLCICLSHHHKSKLTPSRPKSTDKKTDCLDSTVVQILTPEEAPTLKPLRKKKKEETQTKAFQPKFKPNQLSAYRKSPQTSLSEINLRNLLK